MGERPAPCLGELRDRLSESMTGYSFVTDPTNRLADAYLELVGRACLPSPSGLLVGSADGPPIWDGKKVYNYLQTHDVCLRSIMVLMHMTGGRGARIQEHLTLACSNTASRQRSIGIYNSELFSITQHHKASRRMNNEFQVARFYPTLVASLLYNYLVFIRPFTSILARRCLAIAPAPTTQPTLLFTPMSTAGGWTTQTFSNTLGQISASVLPSLPVQLNTHLYHQLYIAISEKHVQGIAQPFDQHNNQTRSAPCNIAFTWQSGHHLIQLSTTYGLDGAFSTHLQPRLLQIYTVISTEWHAFLDICYSNPPLKED